jgi:hypothetical protein
VHVKKAKAEPLPFKAEKEAGIFHPNGLTAR